MRSKKSGVGLARRVRGGRVRSALRLLPKCVMRVRADIARSARNRCRHSESRERIAIQPIDNVIQAIVSTRSALLSYSNLAWRQVDVVYDDHNIERVELIFSQELLDGKAAPIHEGLRHRQS